MGRISDALARAEGRLRPTPKDEPHVPWTFDKPTEPIRADHSDDRETFLSEPATLAPAPHQPHQPSSTVAQSAPVATKVLTHTLRADPPPRIVPAELGARLITAQNLPAPVKEQYRRLAATLHQAQREDGVRIVMVASSLPNEGKTLVAANLGLTLSHSFGRRVLMIDADLRKPSLHALFGVPNDQPGLADSFTARTAGQVEPVVLSPKMSLVTAGRYNGDSMSIVTGGVLQRVIQEGASTFDWVILDTPPIGLLADAHVLAAMVDRVLLVINSGKTPYDLIQRSIDVVGRERIIGTVLNRTSQAQVNPSGYDYKSYYESASPASES